MPPLQIGCTIPCSCSIYSNYVCEHMHKKCVVRKSPEIPQPKHAVVSSCGHQVVLLSGKVHVPDGHRVRMADAPALLHRSQVVQLHKAAGINETSGWPSLWWSPIRR